MTNKEVAQILGIVMFIVLLLFAAGTYIGYVASQREAVRQDARAKLYLQCLASVERIANQSKSNYLPSCHQ